MDFAQEKIRVMTETLKNLISEPVKDLECEYIRVPEYKTSNTPPDKNAGWKEYKKDTILKGIDEHHWFHFKIPAIKKQHGKELRISVFTGKEGCWDASNPQGIIFLNGITAQGLDVNHTWLPVEYDKEYDAYIYFYSSMTDNSEYRVNISLIQTDLQIEKLYYHLLVPYECMQLLDSSSYDYINIRDSLDKALFNLDLRDVSSKTFHDSVDKTIECLEKDFYTDICGKGETTISCIGHTHIDVAWLWTVAQTKEKAQRSFATVNNMMKRYDDYMFMSSQPQLYQHVKDNDPELYKEIKKRVKEGRWEVEGAMWLEADTNLISGESLIRQILHGKKFIKDEFGIDSKILWLPDVFGYSAALPQILKKSGITQFFTTKIYWNETNSFPYDTFMWQGIDGTEVFSSFIKEYNHILDAKNIYALSNNYKDKSISTENIMTFGYGDGGGGPTHEMMEHFRRLNKGIPGMPKTVMKKAGQFFDETEEKYTENSYKLRKENRWVGELYLEMHRGTYTSIAKNKKNNRKSELSIMEAETLCVTDMILNGGEYPEKEFHDNQINVLLNQFHDIIPGSSIKEVYDVTDVEYDHILKSTRNTINSKLQNIASKIDTNGGILVYNPTPYEISDVIDFDGNKIFAENIPAHGWKVIDNKTVDMNIHVSEKLIENNLIKVLFNDNYEIISVYDKESDREIIVPGMTANRIEIFEDYPREYDAWEITSYYKQKMWIADDVTDVKYFADGIEITRKYCNSVIRQKIKLNKDSKRIDFETFVDWHEDHVLMKAAFPVDIHSQFATYDIQFGNLERPTHQNTSWDAAKFEVCAHKWADLSECDYGVSILNDCKYGYSIEGNIMKISLLKAATNPNPVADRGTHTFTYSLYPHLGDFRTGKTVMQGYLLNMPLEAVEIKANKSVLPEKFSLINSDKDNVIVETIKKAEDDNTVIARIYEDYNSKTKTIITAGFDFKEVYLCDMLENNIQKLPSSDNKVELNIKNFEIITLKFVI